MTDTVPIDTVVDGRIARHFLRYFNLLGLSVRAWPRRASWRTVLPLICSASIVPFIKAWRSFQAMYSLFVRAYEQRS